MTKGHQSLFSSVATGWVKEEKRKHLYYWKRVRKQIKAVKTEMQMHEIKDTLTKDKMTFMGSSNDQGRKVKMSLKTGHEKLSKMNYKN